jgi:hypothetical protein
MRVFVFCLLLAACVPDFDDPTTVDDLRVVTVEADTPELVVDVGPLATLEQLPRPEDLPALLADVAMRLPDAFPPVTLRPLIVDPQGGGRAVHVRAVVCVSGKGSDTDRGRNMGPGRLRDTLGSASCPEDSPLLREGDMMPLDDASGVVPCDVTLVPTKEMLLQAIVADPYGGVYGLPLTVQLTVTAGEELVVARKRVVFSPMLAPDQAPNHNPAVTRLVSRADEDGPGIPFDLADPLSRPPTVPLGGRLFLEPDRGDTEAYLARVSDRTTGRLSNEPVHEALRYSFFASAGSFGPGTTTTEPPAIRSTEAKHPLQTRYEAPKLLLPGESELVRIWVVVRDERAGASHVQVALRLVAP